MDSKNIVFDKADTQKIIAFIENIGIEVKKSSIDEEIFLPGILIDKGVIIIDKDKLLYEGDLLHEAGHIATLEPQKRVKVYNDVSKNKGDEIATLAWSYAAAYYLKIDPKIVFHDKGYKGESSWLAEHYSTSGDIGVPLLDWMQLTSMSCRSKQGDIIFPNMKKWIRE